MAHVTASTDPAAPPGPVTPTPEALAVARFERLAAATERIALVVRARWLIIGALLAFAAATLTFYAFSQPLALVAAYVVLPALAVVFVAGYNAFFQLTYRRLARFRWAAHAQILLDILVATVLIHFSGGVNSWFWSMYLLFTIEAAFVLEDKNDTWLVGAFGSLAYGALLVAEYYGVIAPSKMPFVGTGLSHNFTYVMVLWSWVVVMNVCVALIGIAAARAQEERRVALEAAVVFDAGTGLYDRAHFLRLVRGEVERAKRYRRCLALVLLAIDDLDGYVQTFGYEDSQALLRLVADVVVGGLRQGRGADAYDLDTTARIEAGMLGILAPETGVDDAVSVAERLREAVDAVCTPRPGSGARRPVTVSIGIAAYPADATDPDGLLSAARRSLDAAVQSGGDRVVASR